jgi:hypothetical protein
VAAAVGREGAVVVDGVAPAALLARAAPHLEATATGPGELRLPRTRRTGSLIARPRVEDLVGKADPTFDSMISGTSD